MKIFLSVMISCLATTAMAQNISMITVGRDVNTFVIGLDNNVSVYLSKDGNISKWGYDKYVAAGLENYRDALDTYAGRTEYYAAIDDSSFRGKLKYIGKDLLSWYASYDNEALRGKLKSIGNISFDYYQAYDNKAFRGNIKMIGRQEVTWYASYDNDALKGKLKSVGPTAFTWYTSLDDVAFRGKIKSIGNASFTWYSSFDRPEYRGSLKSGIGSQYINGIKYILRN
ncbi:MAG: hypothetical protein ABJA37_14145 [Ferruginibacter sp.]